MRTRRVLLILALFALAFAALPASTEYMPIDAVRPGMTGIGKTVFEGTRVDDFKVVVLGVLRNLTGPRRTIILARLDGGPLASAGVIAGMSGSPVYIDGKLVGAIAYALGAFSKEPIAGITPISEMINDAEDGGGRLPAPALGAALPVTRDDILDIVRTALPRLKPFASRPADVQWVGPAVQSGLDAGLGVQLKPIDTPLVLTGFGNETRREIEDVFRPGGFVAVGPSSGDSGHRSAQAPRSSQAGLDPGDSVGVDLMTGDLALSATGTVTEVTGSRVYAFGHPLYNLGPTRFPMSRAYVHALLPSLLSSTKITTTGDVIGTIRQDRASGIAGTLDGGPPMVPLTLTVTRAGGAGRTFRIGLARDELLTPLLAYTAVANVLQSYERALGAATFALKGRAAVRGHEPVIFDDVYIGGSPAIMASAAVSAPLAALMGNEFERVEIDAIDLQVRVSERQESTTIQRAWIDTDRPRAGKTLTLKILLRGYRGEEETRSVPIEIPARATGSVTLLVTDAARLAQWEQRDMRTPQPWTLDQILRAVNRTRRGNRLYVRLVGGAPGALVDGEQFPALPPSVLAIYEANRNSGSFAPLSSALLGEWEIATDVAVLGSRQLTFTVDPDR